MLYEKFTANADSEHIIVGDEEFDRAFLINSSNRQALLDILITKLPDIEFFSLADGLQKAAKTHIHVQSTEQWACLGRKVRFA